MARLLLVILNECKFVPNGGKRVLTHQTKC